MIYYSPEALIKKAEKLNSPAIIIVGGKGNGKTFGIIRKYLEEFLTSGRYLRYVRRYRDSISPKAITSLLKPQIQNIINLSQGEYNNYTLYRGRFFLTRIENGKVVKKNNNPFIVCSALNSVESFTGADEGDCAAIFYDEVLSREKELKDEFVTLMVLHNNCIRNRTEHYTPLIMVGNTFTRNSMILKDFGVDLYNIKPDSVTVIRNDSGDVLSIIERCPSTEKMVESGDIYYNRYNDSRVNMMTTGDWSIGKYPRLTPKYKYNCNTIFSILCIHSVNVVMELCIYKSTPYIIVREPDRNDVYDIKVTTNQLLVKDDMLCYFPNDMYVFTLIGTLIVRKQILFENGEVGEKFRDFLLNLNGAEKLGGLFK